MNFQGLYCFVFRNDELQLEGFVEAGVNPKLQTIDEPITTNDSPRLDKTRLARHARRCRLKLYQLLNFSKKEIIMKTKFIASTLIALATIASSSAFASLSYGTGDADPVENTPTLSKLTRAEVSSDTAAWNKTHYSANLESVVFADVEAVPATTFVSKVSRNDIKTETALWNKKHYFENLESATVIDRN